MRHPKCIAALIHRKICLTLISHLHQCEQDEIQNISTQCNFLGEPKLETVIKEKPAVANIHCHINLLLKQMMIPSYEEAVKEFVFPDVDVNVDIIIHCYAFLTMFPSTKQLERLPSIASNFAIRFHPRST